MLFHSVFAVFLDIIVKDTLPNLDTHRVSEACTPIEVLENVVKPIKPGLEDCP